jgi:uroporphyrinogen-III synthase
MDESPVSPRPSAGPPASFAGLRVAAFESRRAEEMRRLIRRFEGEPLVAPAMREIPLEDQTEALECARRLVAGRVDVLILLTGVGTRTLVQAASSAYPTAQLVQALSTVCLVARGPKPIVALAELGLKPTIAVPEPNTWRDLLAALDARMSLAGRRVDVQEYGSSNAELLGALAARGAEVRRVPVYRWALPEDVQPLRQALSAICEGQAHVLLFTTSNQVDNVLRVAKEMGLDGKLRQAAGRCVVASVGPICSATLTQQGLPADLEATHPRMGTLVHEAAQQARRRLAGKRNHPPGAL